MLDIGFGEIVVIALLALLVFGPDRLPKVASEAARTLRQVRVMATAARRDLADAAGLEQDPELSAAMRDLRDLDPRRVLQPLDEPSGAKGGRPGAPTTAQGAASRPVASAGAQGAAPALGGDSSAELLPGPEPTPASSSVPAPAPVDPDWT